MKSARFSLRGFTLVELLVVIAIVSILVACSCRRCNRRERLPGE